MPAPFRKPRRMEEPGPTQVSRLVPPPSDGVQFTVAGQRRIFTGFPCMQAFPERSHAAGLPVKEGAVTLGSAGAHHETESDDVLDLEGRDERRHTGRARVRGAGVLLPERRGVMARGGLARAVDASAGQVTLLDDDHVVYGPMSLDAE